MPAASSLSSLAPVEKRRVARLVQELLQVKERSEKRSRDWRMEKSELNAFAAFEKCRRCALEARLGLIRLEKAAARVQNIELAQETVELRGKVVKSQKSIKVYQQQLLLAKSSQKKSQQSVSVQTMKMEQQSSGTQTLPTQKAAASSILFEDFANSKEEVTTEEDRYEVTRNALKIAFPKSHTPNQVTAFELEEAISAVADVSLSSLQETPQTQIALIQTVGIQGLEDILELGAGDGRSAIALFFLTQAQRVRGVELCASRFAAGREALKRLSTHLRSPCCDIVADAGGLIRLELRHQSKRVLELRRGDFLHMPATAIREADLVWLDAKTPLVRDNQLRILMEATAANAIVATRSSTPLERTAPHLNLRTKLRLPWTLAVYDCSHDMMHPIFPTRSKSKPKSFFFAQHADTMPPEKQSAARAGGRCQQFAAGDLVLVTSKNGPVRRARIVAHLRSPYLSVIYESDGRIEDRVHVTRISSLPIKSDREILADCHNTLPQEQGHSLPLSRKKGRHAASSAAQWVSVWDTPATPVSTSGTRDHYEDFDDIVLLPSSPPSFHHRRLHRH